jgi:hypothetical protein
MENDQSRRSAEQPAPPRPTQPGQLGAQVGDHHVPALDQALGLRRGDPGLD